ncbi:DUF3040 domain-containing protein [Flexivirga caeni]|uniref:DUF3040 domain-containing protein n=1 Tax=Flexivirga caeni TaxID=2294115 RepID=A0A3M9MI08_9MICO|nr:DUF3040 domain-containing protein [Flexivirga caeni]RNI24473.1 DUF3040 domain-containing protein [Flexivirga caeni]
MPLSEHEQRLLDQMEQALKVEDPKFASHMLAHPGRSRLRRRIAIGVCGLVVGLALVVIGMASTQIWLGVVGFVVMVAGAAYAFKPDRVRDFGTVEDDGSITTARPKRASRGNDSFMQRLEERWDRRRGQGW